MSSEPIKVLYVALEEDIREDDIQPLVDAIRCMRQVAAVTTLRVDLADYSAREQLSHRWVMIFYDVLHALREGRRITIEPRKGER